MRRASAIVGAVVCFAAAAILVFAAGLPDRAAYSGVIGAAGERIAPEMGATAPTFRTATLDGTFDLAALHGQPVVLNFWATWCAPCAIEMPELQRLHEEFPYVTVIGVNMGEPREAVAAWGDSYDLTFQLALDPDEQIARLYALRGAPSTYIITPSGTISQIYFGAANFASLREAVSPFVKP